MTEIQNLQDLDTEELLELIKEKKIQLFKKY